MAGIELDEAQQFVAGATAGVGRDGKWAAFEVGLYCPRQNLKTEYLLARALAGLFLFREEYIVFSAHQVKTSTKAFRRLKRAIDRNPRLGARIVRVSNRIGSESIELSSGQTLECVARSTSSGRGFSGDCLLLDESHELDGEQLAAVLPMVATRKNPQILYAASLANENSLHLAGVRERALEGKPNVAWIEWSMADDDQVDDRAVWAACNPAYPSRISLEYMEREYGTLGPDLFARERLGRSDWSANRPGEWQVFSEADWLAITRDPNGDPWVFGSDVPAVAPAEPAQPFDPFEAWGPSGVPPWVSRVGL
jgi:phage terminase large subunit-like protein